MLEKVEFKYSLGQTVKHKESNKESKICKQSRELCDDGTVFVTYVLDKFACCTIPEKDLDNNFQVIEEKKLGIDDITNFYNILMKNEAIKIREEIFKPENVIVGSYNYGMISEAVELAHYLTDGTTTSEKYSTLEPARWYSCTSFQYQIGQKIKSKMDGKVYEIKEKIFDLYNISECGFDCGVTNLVGEDQINKDFETEDKPFSSIHHEDPTLIYASTACNKCGNSSGCMCPRK